MDARERLRLYLEQRRELGEQELVLDRLDVDDVLRLVGALGAAPASPAAGAPSRRPPPDTADLGRPASAVREDAAGADGARTNSGRADVVDGERTRSASGEVTAAGRGSSPPDERRPEEPMGSLVDWRETLRAAGGGPPGLVTPPVAKRQGEPEKGEGEGEMARRKKADSATTAEPGEVPAPAAPPRGTRKTASKAEAASGGAPVQLPSWAAELDIPAGLSVGDSGALDATFARLRSLDELARVTEGCTRCPLYRTATHAVPGDGNPDADLVCVGEAPGANEDASGRPFVGAAGQLLTKILAAIKLSREDVFICNVLKHRPPGNRNPAPDEVEACSPYLLRQLELVKPKVILTLGTFAAQTLLATKTPIGKLRGQVHLYHGIPLVVTYHPAALLRNSAWKRPTWEDVQLARRLLDRAPGSGA